MYSNIMKISPNSDIFYISARNIDCGYSLEVPRPGGSNECQQSIYFSRNTPARRFLRLPKIYVLSRNNKNNLYLCKPQF